MAFLLRAIKKHKIERLVTRHIQKREGPIQRQDPEMKEMAAGGFGRSATTLAMVIIPPMWGTTAM